MSDDAPTLLSERLVRFRRWLDQSKEELRIHPSLCIVNGDATDGTRNAPVLTIGNTKRNPPALDGRLGMAEGATSHLYDRTMGCQVRSIKEIKAKEELFSIPQSYMVTPDLVAASDAGQAVLACIQAEHGGSFWDAFENTRTCESRLCGASLKNKPGQQTAVKILQERKKVMSHVPAQDIKLAPRQVVSTRAPFLAFLIQQRFAGDHVPVRANTFEDSYKGPTARTSVSSIDALPPMAPESFSPYAHILPSSVSVPICWKRSELAVFASCIPGTTLMNETCSTTYQLVAEYMALIDAGITKRFPTIFPPGVLTWERWVWAASVVSSRILPATLLRQKEAMQSPAHIVNELGVMIPLLDMLNHEIEEHQVACEISDSAVARCKIKKHAELYICYGDFSNSRLIMDYGFAQINNKADKVLMGWALSDGVGNRSSPPVDFHPIEPTAHVFDTKDESAIAAWWTKRRLDALEREAFRHPEARTAFESLKNGWKMSVNAYQDHAYDPIFLSVAVVATAPDDQRLGESKLAITKSHLRLLRSYLHYTYSMKLEKLLQNLDAGLNGHIPMVKLWTKASGGGLNHDSKSDGKQGWHSFFDSHVYGSSMEVENHFYSMGVVSCALTLFDGQLKCLQSSIDGIVDDETFASGVLKQLKELDFELADDDDEPMSAASANGTSEARAPSESSADRPAAIKLHVGNLSYQTTPSDLYDYFSAQYGKHNVIECHIPSERATGRSRGFGFLTMPDKVALEALTSSKKHHVHGRLLKVAKSNSAGSNVRQVETASVPLSSDRCQTCGYRPKYCTCAKPNLPAEPTLSPDPSMRPPARYEEYHRVSYNDHDGYGRPSRYRHDEEDYRHDEYRRRRDRSYDYHDRYGDPYDDRYGDRYDDRYDDRRRSSSHRREERRNRSRSRERHRSRKSSKRRERSRSAKS